MEPRIRPAAPAWIGLVLIAARVLAILAVLAGLAAGFLANTFTAFTCFDTCPAAEGYISNVGQGAIQLLTPCVALATLALALFLAYCLATRRFRRAVMVFLVFFVGVLLGVAALNALLQHARATLPIEDGVLFGHAVVEWARQWALAILLIAGVWSGGLPCLEWGRRWERLDQRSST
jgi:hypothetical protein